MTFDPKQHLNKIRFIDQDINSRIKEKEKLRDTLILKTSTINEDKVQESNQGAFDDKYSNYLEFAEHIDSKIDELVNFKKEVTEEIDQLKDQRHRIILREKYINLNTFEYIAEALGYDLRWVYRVHGEALLAYKNIFLKSHEKPC